MRVSAASTIGLIRRIGWSAGTNESGVTASMMLAWSSASPRTGAASWRYASAANPMIPCDAAHSAGWTERLKHLSVNSRGGDENKACAAR